MGTFKDTLNVKVNQGELISKISILEEQIGSVIVGTVLLDANTPVNGAAAVLSYVNSDTKEVVPLSFMFTDMNGQFVFALKNPTWDYVINIVYNEEVWFYETNLKRVRP